MLWSNWRSTYYKYHSKTCYIVTELITASQRHTLFIAYSTHFRVITRFLSENKHELNMLIQIKKKNELALLVCTIYLANNLWILLTIVKLLHTISC